jgi:hypothetical protein
MLTGLRIGRERLSIRWNLNHNRQSLNDPLVAKSGPGGEPSPGTVRIHEEELVARIGRNVEVNDGGSECVITAGLEVVLAVRGGGRVSIEGGLQGDGFRHGVVH